MALSTGLVQIGDEDRATLLSWTRSSSVRAGLSTRAKIVLAAGDGEGTSSIARRLGVSRPTVIQWRERIDDAAIIAATLDPPPERLGVSHWSCRLLAAELKIGHATIARAWRRYGVQPVSYTHLRAH